MLDATDRAVSNGEPEFYYPWHNHFLPKYSDVVVCIYDVSKLGAPVPIDLTHTHPHGRLGRIAGECVLCSPAEFFIEPNPRLH